MSRAALKILGEAMEADPENTFVGPWDIPEDMGLGKTLRRLDIIAEDSTRDETGAHRFLMEGVHAERKKDINVHKFFLQASAGRPGTACCSRRWITSHYESANALYAIEEIRSRSCQVDPDEWPFLDIPQW
jgi:hypothetical protein